SQWSPSYFAPQAKSTRQALSCSAWAHACLSGSQEEGPKASWAHWAPCYLVRGFRLVPSLEERHSFSSGLLAALQHSWAFTFLQSLSSPLRTLREMCACWHNGEGSPEARYCKVRRADSRRTSLLSSLIL